ncbi:MAG: methylmalonyl Co-A mutase-associated GTPase MeaB [Candidatus Zixiibacteriota bacterium]|nr:MAG: methylmalonyl Co-A mutase-associated GTPase MeaB [candidate division Zixibacteria bacterium]
MTILERFFAGDIRALSKVISHIENRSDGYQKLLGRLYTKAGNSLRIGITGPPGAGKSTLVNGLVHEYLAQKRRVGVVAVDPTSPFTGGALLGDRVRMHEFPTGGEVYFRSMATRGATGGLAGATGNVAVALDAFGYDITLIETVGVGQVELDIIDTCDTVVVAIVPESGDAVQTMKAGLMEIADIFVVNKADRPGAEKLSFDLGQMLDTKARKEGAWPIPVLSTVAVDRKNVDELHRKIDEHIAFVKTSGQFEKHRRQQVKKKILSILKHQFQKEFLERLAGEVDFEDVIDGILSGKTNPFQVGQELFDRFSAPQ